MLLTAIQCSYLTFIFLKFLEQGIAGRHIQSMSDGDLADMKIMKGDRMDILKAVKDNDSKVRIYMLFINFSIFRNLYLYNLCGNLLSHVFDFFLNII